MHKLLVFDLDGTLANIGKGINEQALMLLKKLEATGYLIAICSGKPTFYLCGFMRQVGLEKPILIGENGANIQYGIDLPPENYYVYPYSDSAKSQIQLMRKVLDETFDGSLWYQPNIAGLTPFPKSESEFDKISALIEDYKGQLTHVLVYRHADSFDITPQEINKHNGLKFLTTISGIGPEDMIAIGDGVNDIPMFQYVDFSIGIGDSVKNSTSICFDRITDALQYILTNKL